MGEGYDWLRRSSARRTKKLDLGRSIRLAAATAMAGLSASAVQSAAMPSTSAPAPVARPALWVVADQDTIIYLFGTFHAHDGKSRWFTDAVKNAFDGSEELVLETVIPNSPEELNQVLGRFRGPKPAATSAGLTSARSAMTAARSAGLTVDNGADTVLSRAAAEAGKPVEGLESFEQQLRMYDRMPAPPAAPPARAPAAPNAALAAFMRQMMAAWDRGDPSTFEAVVGSIKAQSPDAYRMMFQERNAEWAAWIQRRLDEPGTVFVAVGTGHLVGRDSVQAQLAQRGIPSARVN